MVRRPKSKLKTIKLLKNKTKKNTEDICVLGLDKDFLDITPKTRSIKEY